jgi:hypothetical protein
VPRPATGETFIARVRIPLESWRKLEESVGDKQRAVWIREHVEAVNSDAKLWHDCRRIAKARNEDLWSVILAALGRYRARNRALLGDEDE